MSNVTISVQHISRNTRRSTGPFACTLNFDSFRLVHFIRVLINCNGNITYFLS
jgi:hypothetical protein